MWFIGVNISANCTSMWFFPLGCYIRQSRVLLLPLVRDLLLVMVYSKHTCFVDVPWCVGAGGGAFVDHDVPQKVPFFGDDFYFRSVNCRMCHV